jgi:phage/plasmid-associated DNA primase
MALTGRLSGITVLDFDNKEVFDGMKEEFPWLKEQPCVWTRRGVHVYCKYNSSIRQPDKSQGLELDVQGGDPRGKSASLVIAPPTCYSFQDEHRGLQRVTYLWEKAGPLDDIPDDLLACINPPRVLQPPAAEPRTDAKHQVASGAEVADIITLLAKHEREVGHSYQEWFRILCACHSVGRSSGDLETWRKHAHEISKASPKYDPEATDTKFAEGSKFGSYSIGTLKYYARKAYPDDFSAITAKVTHLNEQVVFEQGALRDFFLDVYGDNLICCKGAEGKWDCLFYIWRENKAVWTCDDGTALRDDIHDLCRGLIGQSHATWLERYKTVHDRWISLKNSGSPDAEEVQKAKHEMDDFKKKVDTVLKIKQKFGDADTKAVYSLVKSKLVATALVAKNPFDERREVFAFDNRCYDLKSNTFFKATKYDYILTTNGKNWHDPTIQEQDRIAGLISQIFPDQEKLRCWVSIAHASLSGKRHEKFFFFTGGGRNGKGFLSEMLQYLLGPYGYKAHLKLLTDPFKDGSNVSLRNCHKKRVILFTEPEENNTERFRLNNIKALTGDEDQNARGHYSMDTNTRIFGTFIAECNTMPKLVGKAGEAVMARVVKLDFESTFTADEEKLAQHDEANRIYIYPEDESLKEGDFKEAHFCAFFDYIVKTHDEYGKLYIPQCAKAAALEYLQDEDDFANWFQSKFIKGAPEELKHVYFLPIKTLFEMYQESTAFYLLSREDQSKYTLKRFKETLSKNVLVGPYFVEAKKASHVLEWQSGARPNPLWVSQTRNDKQGIIGWCPLDVNDIWSSSTSEEIGISCAESTKHTATSMPPKKKQVVTAFSGIHLPSAKDVAERQQKRQRTDFFAAHLKNKAEKTGV